MKKNILFRILLVMICLCGGCASPKLAGTFDGKIYTSSQADYSVPIPVTTYGGEVAGDDEHGVTFRDDMGMRVSFYSFPAGTEIMSILQTSGRQQALEKYIGRLYLGTTPMNYHPDICDGTMSFVFSKDGVNQTGVAAFIHGSQIYSVEFDLPTATKALWRGTELEQTEWIEKRAVELIQTIQIK